MRGSAMQRVLAGIVGLTLVLAACAPPGAPGSGGGSTAADDLTQRARVANVMRTGGWASSQPHHPFGEWASDQGYKKIMAICVDYAFGQEVCGGFLRTFAGERGGELVKQLWDPRNTPDFSSYLAQVQGSGAD